MTCHTWRHCNSWFGLHHAAEFSETFVQKYVAFCSTVPNSQLNIKGQVPGRAGRAPFFLDVDVIFKICKLMTTVSGKLEPNMIEIIEIFSRKIWQN